MALVLFALMTLGIAEAIDLGVERGGVGWLEIITVSRTVNAAVTGAALLAALRTGHPAFGAVMLAPLPATRLAWLIAIGGGLLDATGLVSLAIGLERAPTWLVGLASSFGPAVTILVAVGFLGERLRPIQWLGLGGIGLGLVAIAIP